MYRSCPQYPMPLYGPEMQSPYFGMEPFFPGLGMGMQQPFFPCPGPTPMPPMPCPGMGYPPVEVQNMVREMLEMVRQIYQQQCPAGS
ncbi:MAG: hypothetical protein GXW85_07130 [Clostridia bacterium]|nr:hypothetical protein [Clostridia bacterium]